MKSTIYRTLALASLLIVITPVMQVQAEPKSALTRLFENLDKDRDKSLSESEYVAKKWGEDKAKALRDFKSLDKDKNKRLMLNEFKKR